MDASRIALKKDAIEELLLYVLNAAEIDPSSDTKLNSLALATDIWIWNPQQISEVHHLSNRIVIMLKKVRTPIIVKLTSLGVSGQ